MQILRLRGTVTCDHHLSLTLPPDFPEGEVVITVRSANADAPADDIVAQQQFSDLRSFFEFLKTVPPTGRTQEKIDRPIQEERNSWK